MVIESTPDEVFELSATIAFQSVPDLTLQLEAYRRESVGPQAVHLRGYIGHETTLMTVATIALESLGGSPSAEISDDDRSECGKVISEAELMQRHAQMKREASRVKMAAVLLLPVLIPLWVAGCVWTVVSLPYRIWRAYRTLQLLEKDRHDTDS